MNLPDESSWTTRKLDLEITKHTVSMIVNKGHYRFLNSAELTEKVSRNIHELVYQLEASVLGLEKERQVETTTLVPATWWDAVKERWLERWGWKVNRRKIDTVVRTWKICPHLEIPDPASIHWVFHYQWLESPLGPEKSLNR